MTDTYYMPMMPQSCGVRPGVADLWVETLPGGEKMWWRWSGKVWVHDGDTITMPSQSPPPDSPG